MQRAKGETETQDSREISQQNLETEEKTVRII